MKHSKYHSRFVTALKFRGIEEVGTLNELTNVLHKRADSDRQLDSLYSQMCSILEPPYCQMTHCNLHTVYGMCGCREDRVPGRCDIHKKYMDRCKVRDEKIKNDFIEFTMNEYGCTKEVAESSFIGLLERNLDHATIAKKLKNGDFKKVQVEAPPQEM